MAPGCVNPVSSYPAVHSVVSPAWQRSQTWQLRKPSPTTFLPTSDCGVPGPTASTVPDHSCPGVSGYRTYPSGRLPWYTSRSLPQMPTAWTRTSASPAPGGVGS